jgi:pimeloyl-ACP methyl ester carboxylesterase
LGDPEKIGIASYADDLLAMMEHLSIPRAIVGGISMGAAVALNFTLRFPDRALGLILSRPAWLDRPLTERSEIFPLMAQLIRQHGAKRGLEIFKQSEDYAYVLGLSPDAADSLVRHFEHPRAEETVVKLERIPKDVPNHDRREWGAIRVPTLVLANRRDPIHPFDYGEVLAGAIPHAELKELTPKSVDKAHHAAEVQAFIEEFLRDHYLKPYRTSYNLQEI